MLTGLLPIDKPVGVRSTDCVSKVKAILRRACGGEMPKIGHAGTLDSTASGLLLILTGTATRLSDYAMMMPKVYRAVIRLGSSTDTCDYSGAVTFEGDCSGISGSDVDDVLPPLWGMRMQRPPVISALKKDGRPAHKLARAGEDVDLASRPVFMRSVRRTSDVTDGRFGIEVACGKGTYIRSIARDIGDALGCGAHIESLRRVSLGGFCADDAVSFDELLSSEADALPIRPIRDICPQFHRIELAPAAEAKLADGISVPLVGAGRYIPGVVPPDRALCAAGANMISFVKMNRDGGRLMLKPAANIKYN